MSAKREIENFRPILWCPQGGIRIGFNLILTRFWADSKWFEAVWDRFEAKVQPRNKTLQTASNHFRDSEIQCTKFREIQCTTCSDWFKRLVWILLRIGFYYFCTHQRQSSSQSHLSRYSPSSSSSSPIHLPCFGAGTIQGRLGVMTSKGSLYACKIS